MKIAVNGVSGFIGGELCRFFRARGYEVVTIPRASYADENVLKNLQSSPPINPLVPFTAIFIFCLFDKFCFDACGQI